MRIESACGRVHRRLTIFPDLARELIVGRLQQGYDVVVQWIHVLHQPLFGRVFHFARVVNDAEISRSLVIRFA